MKYALLLIAVILLNACSGKPLTATECHAVTAREIDFAVSKAPASERVDFRAFLEARGHDALADCLAGKTYRRRDYDCMRAARDPQAIGRCIAAASKRLNR